MDDVEKIAVYVADEEASKFLEFQRYYKEFTLLKDSGVFDVRNGSVTLHFDKDGELKAIHRSDVLYSSRHDVA